MEDKIESDDDELRYRTEEDSEDDNGPNDSDIDDGSAEEVDGELNPIRKAIFVSIMLMGDSEEAELDEWEGPELCRMVLEACGHEKLYLRYYGVLGRKLCRISKGCAKTFEESFVQEYSMVDRLETKKLSHLAKFFAHLLSTKSLPWNVLGCLRLSENTSPSSRVFVKNLFQELSDLLGIDSLCEHINDPSMSKVLESIFPKHSPETMRFAINFFTALGLGRLTEKPRQWQGKEPLSGLRRRNRRAQVF